MDPITQFRRRVVQVLSFVLGGLAIPSSVVNAYQCYERADPFLGVAAAAYFVCGVALLRVTRRARTHEVRNAFLFWATIEVFAAVLMETPAGSSHMLGICGVLIVLLGHVAGHEAHRARWHLLGAASFPAVLFARELYRPHPLLEDPLELIPQAAAGGLAIYGIGVIIDRMIAAFDAQAERARRAEIAKDRFLENMSHELRTPLTAILGYAEMIEEEGFEDPDASRQDLGHIRRSSMHLLGIINDLLDLSRLGSEAEPRLELTSVELGDVLESALNDVHPQVEKNRNEVVLPASTARVMANRDALRRVLVNLLGNAAKFTADGRIAIAVTVAGHRVTIEVTDTGVGFPSELAERIFQPFAQADDTRTRAFGGTGLGLAISRRLVEAMNGTLEARSVPGEGATFRLVLDRSLPAHLPAEARAAG